MPENSSFWKKSQADYTISDALKYVAIMTPIALAAPYVMLGALGGAMLAYDAGKKKLKRIKSRKK